MKTFSDGFAGKRVLLRLLIAIAQLFSSWVHWYYLPYTDVKDKILNHHSFVKKTLILGLEIIIST